MSEPVGQVICILSKTCVDFFGGKDLVAIDLKGQSKRYFVRVDGITENLSRKMA